MNGSSLQGLPDTYAKVAMGLSGAQQGTGGMNMNTQAVVGTQQALDPLSNPAFTGQQMVREEQQRTQAGMQAMQTQIPQTMVAQQRMIDARNTDMSDAAYRAQSKLTHDTADMIRAMGGDQVLMRAASISPAMVAKGKIDSSGLGQGIGGIVHRDVLKSKGIIA